MFKKAWEAVMLVVVSFVLITIVIASIRPYMWIIGVGVALLVLAAIAKLMFFRRRF